jgi:hypothetical protein
MTAFSSIKLPSHPFSEAVPGSLPILAGPLLSVIREPADPVRVLAERGTVCKDAPGNAHAAPTAAASAVVDVQTHRTLSASALTKPAQPSSIVLS